MHDDSEEFGYAEEAILLDQVFDEEIDEGLEWIVDLAQSPLFREMPLSEIEKDLPFTGNEIGEPVKAYSILNTDKTKNIIIVFKSKGGDRHWINLKVWKKNKAGVFKQRQSYNISQLNLGSVLTTLIHIDKFIHE